MCSDCQLVISTCRMLVSTGAQQWARQHDIHTCNPDELITGKLDYLLAFFCVNYMDIRPYRRMKNNLIV